jgi:hypothetical protein
VIVTPAVGNPQTTFVFAFATPVDTFRRHGFRVYEEVRGRASGSDGANGSGCKSSFRVVVFPPEAKAGARVSAAERPGVGWCTGTYDADIVELSLPGCPLHQTIGQPSPCGRLVPSVERTFVPFSFKVT